MPSQDNGELRESILKPIVYYVLCIMYYEQEVKYLCFFLVLLIILSNLLPKIHTSKETILKANGKFELGILISRKVSNLSRRFEIF